MAESHCQLRGPCESGRWPPPHTWGQMSPSQKQPCNRCICYLCLQRSWLFPERVTRCLGCDPRSGLCSYCHTLMALPPRQRVRGSSSCPDWRQPLWRCPVPIPKCFSFSIKFSKGGRGELVENKYSDYFFLSMQKPEHFTR